LCPEARELLTALGKDPRRGIAKLQTHQGELVNANGREFVTVGDLRSEALWKHALGELVARQLVEQYKGGGEADASAVFYYATNYGFQAIDHLAGEDGVKSHSQEIEKTPARVLALPASRPKIAFIRWGTEDEQRAVTTLGGTKHYYSFDRQGQARGFILRNDGDEAALDVAVERFEVDGSSWASRTIPRIEAGTERYALVWRADASLLSTDDKWNLVASLGTASRRRASYPGGGPDYLIAISVVYRDYNNVCYRTRADMAFMPALLEVEFRSIKQERLPTSALPY
jgi:hypothetical protein